MPLVQTRGAASAQGFGEFAQVTAVNYIEDVFSTYLYTGNGSTQTITNGIDLSTKGGLVWVKPRSVADWHNLYDTVRGASKSLATNVTDAQYDLAGNGVSAFGTTGFTINGSNDQYNTSAQTYVSWTFREQPKFFDIVTWTGTGSVQNISHNLGSVPGCIIVKRTDTSSNWVVYHRSLNTTSGGLLALNLTSGELADANAFNSTVPTSTVFTVGSANSTNGSGGTFVAYIFAHDAGGFPVSGGGSTNGISCGSYTGNGSGTAGTTVNLGYEPQWLLVKLASSAGENWTLYDVMRGMPVVSSDSALTHPLYANTLDAELNGYSISPLATGFRCNTTHISVNGSGQTYIYIAIRRGPMKVPTTGTSVFGLSARTGTGADATVTGGQTDDAVLIKNRGSAIASLFSSRLTGTGYLVTSTTAAEVAAGATILQANPWDVMDGVKVGTTSTITNASGNTFINYLFKRAPSFFDEVCYTGTGVAGTQAHNLGAVPEMIIVKPRTGVSSWNVYLQTLGNGFAVALNSTSASSSVVFWNNTNPTSSVFSLGSGAVVNGSGITYVAYLFATCAGVSKVGSYTGTATTLQVDCGFTAGARFVLIKRTDSTGDWYVWDTARGIVSGNDPYWLLNTGGAEVTSTDYVDTYSAGFEISSTAPAAINSSGGTFIFLAIA